MDRLFGTDGIRARAGTFPLDQATIPAIGQAIGEAIGGPILIGRDPRTSSPWILNLLKQGLLLARVEFEDAGVLPTPAVALLTQQTDSRGGLMISASHNPFEDNGIKVFGPDGRKLDDGDEAGIEAKVRALQIINGSRQDAPPRGPTEDEGTSPFAEDYMELLRRRFPQGRWMEGLRILLDCANGAMSGVAPRLLESMGADVAGIHRSPTGENINAGCGAVSPQDLVRHVRKDAPDLGAAFDGDGDRSIFVSPAGTLVDGDAVLYVMARLMKQSGRLEPPIVVGTSMTNYGLEQALEREGIRLIRTDVGDRYVFREMLSVGAQLGGEPSGHIIFSDYGISGDGLLTTLKLCEAMVSGGASLDGLIEGWHPTPQLLIGLRVKEKLPLDSVSGVSEKIQDIALRLAGRGRIVVRYSGTEPLLRIMVESDSAQTNDTCAEELTEVVRRSLPSP